jgi:hypothetical protein
VAFQTSGFQPTPQENLIESGVAQAGVGWGMETGTPRFLAGASRRALPVEKNPRAGPAPEKRRQASSSTSARSRFSRCSGKVPLKIGLILF